MVGNVKQEEYESIQEAARVYGDGNKVNFNLLAL